MGEAKDEGLPALGERALGDLAKVFARFAPGAEEALVEAIIKAKRIVLYGAGREGLQMDGFAMRLFHMGRDVHLVGDMTTPPVGQGDLLIVSAGPGASRRARKSPSSPPSPRDAPPPAPTSSFTFPPRPWPTIKRQAFPCCRWVRFSRRRR
jgi:hypothetical protein